jgi:hypothetical protein
MMPLDTKSPYWPSWASWPLGISVILADLAEDDRSILASIDGDLASRRAERFPDDVDASLLIVVLGSQSAKCLDGPQ